MISIIIAIYNRKDELYELLHSLGQQTDMAFEVIVVDDGSQVDLMSVVSMFENQLSLRYFKKSNSGPGLSRNYGVQHTSGEWLVFLDSDVIVEKDYIANIKKNISQHPADAFGGSDKAHKGFNIMQKAISYAMTSFLTTGGIRGRKHAVMKFQPRSFNMGVRKAAFEQVGGFSKMRVGEDPDLSMTLWEQGFTTVYYGDIEVYHKRRTNFSKFSRQVYEFGCARPILNVRHPKYVKFSFSFPSFFLLGYVLGCIEYFFFERGFILALYGMYSFLVFFHALFKSANISIATMAVLATYIQMFSYGWGFLKSWFKLNVLQMKPEEAFPHHFYKEES